MKTSVAMCTYNGGGYLERQLQSILQQTVPVDEIIICDDRSTDESMALLQHYSSVNNTIQLHINDSTLGVIKNFEKAISLCTGDVIFLCDQDDVWQPGKVKRVLQHFKNSAALGVISDASIINDLGEETGHTLWEALLFKQSLVNEQDLFRYQLMYRNMVTGACLAIKREAVDLVLPIPSHPHLLHDEWIGLKLGEINALTYLNECLVQYRVHGNQQTASIWQKGEEDALHRVSILNNKMNEYPLVHYRHWKKRLKRLDELAQLGLQIETSIYEECRYRRKSSYIQLLKQYGVMSRKWRLLKTFVKGNENISIADVVKL